MARVLQTGLILLLLTQAVLGGTAWVTAVNQDGTAFNFYDAKWIWADQLPSAIEVRDVATQQILGQITRCSLTDYNSICAGIINLNHDYGTVIKVEFRIRYDNVPGGYGTVYSGWYPVYINNNQVYISFKPKPPSSLTVQ